MNYVLMNTMMFMNNITEIIRKIKYSRLNPGERFLVDVFCNLKEKVSDDKPEFIFYVINDEVLFEYDIKNNFMVSHFEKIWLISKINHTIRRLKFDGLIKDMSFRYLKINPQPILVDDPAYEKNWEQLKLKDII